MLNKIILALLVAITFFMSGCTNEEGENRLTTQQMIDDANYESVIRILQPKEEKSDEDYLALGAAYMGDAGYSVTDLVSAISKSNEEEEDDAFLILVKELNENTDENSLNNLQKAADSYAKVLDPSVCLNDAQLSDSQKDICVYIALAHSMKVATAISYLGDVGELKTSYDEEGEITDDWTASACAIHYTYSSTEDEKCTFMKDPNIITFESNKSYQPLSVIVNGNSFDYLMTLQYPRQTILTNGYCSLDFQSCDKGEEECFACPLNQSSSDEELTVTNVLVDTFNDSIHILLGALDNNEHLTENIKEYQNEITNYQDRDITIEDIVKYLEDI